MFRKEPSMIKSWCEKGPDEYVKIQREILNYAVRMLKPGGMMVYSTCTFSIEENEQQIKWLMSEYPELHIVNIEKNNGFSEGLEGLTEAVRLWPHLIKGEGHFVALLQKDFGKEPSRKFKPFLYPVKVDLGDFDKFSRQLLNKGFALDRLFRIEDKLYALPEGLVDIKGLRILRSGWYLGDFNRDRFEPSSHFAMGLTSEEAASKINYSSDSIEVIKYLKGESLPTTEEKGYYLICVDDYPLGFAKASGGILKNKYNASWRLQ